MFNELGNEIRHERMFKGLSQTELSKRTGIDVKTISLIERGIRRKPKQETIFKLSEVIDIFDLDALKKAGYTPEEIIDYLENIKGQKRYDFDFTITYKGHGMMYDYDKENAELNLKYLFEDIVGCNEPKLDAVDENIILDKSDCTIRIDDKNGR